MTPVTQSRSSAGTGIAFILFGMLAITVNDLLIKQMSGAYPLHQLVFVRSLIGLPFSLALVRYEGGARLLRPSRPGLQILRGLLIVAANMTYFLALAVLPLADATALFFAAPLFITVLSVPILGEKVGPVRLTAVLVGFSGVLLMQRPWAGSDTLEVARIVLLLPIAAALLYALTQLLTRKLGSTTTASALSVYIQVTFLVVAAGFYVVAGDGRLAEGLDHPSWQFLLRAWIRPEAGDWWFLIGLGLNSAIIGYCLSAAYRMTDAAVIAPFEYVGLPLAVFWGWLIWADLPDWEVWTGMALIAASGLFVFLREQRKARPVAPPGPGPGTRR